MIHVSNRFHEGSIDYRATGKNIGERLEEIMNLQDVSSCCAENDECMECGISCLYEQEVEPGQTLADWLYNPDVQGDYDLRRMLMDIFQTFSEMDGDADCTIDISLGTQDGCICDKAGYWSVLVKEKRASEKHSNNS